MFALRFVVHTSSRTLCPYLYCSTVCGDCLHRFESRQRRTTLQCAFFAAVSMPVGKTFFWPTMLAVASDDFPNLVLCDQLHGRRWDAIRRIDWFKLRLDTSRIAIAVKHCRRLHQSSQVCMKSTRGYSIKVLVFQRRFGLDAENEENCSRNWPKSAKAS